MAENAETIKPDLSALRIEESARSSGASSKTLRYLALIVTIIAIAGGSAVAYFNRPQEVEVASVRMTRAGEPVTLLNASGYVTPRQRATVAAKITARVVTMLADEGVAVEAGQLLAKLDDTDARKRLLAARTARDVSVASIKDLEVTLAGAERDLKRQHQLRESGVSTEQALDNANTSTDSLRARLLMAHEQVRATEANIAIANLDLDSCSVRAPFAGVVVSKDAQVGEMVSPISAGGFTRTGIATIVDMSSLEVEVDVNESYIARVKSGQRVDATLDAYPDWQIPARVRTIIPTADRQKATVKVRIAFDKLDPRILPDMGVKVAFLAEQQPAAQASGVRSVIPKDAIREDKGKKVVFVLNSDRIERRAVTVGASRGDGVEVAAGLSEGEQVVTRGPADLHDGQKVRVKRENNP
jgi:HlyD family secretion protein